MKKSNLNNLIQNLSLNPETDIMTTWTAMPEYQTMLNVIGVVDPARLLFTWLRADIAETNELVDIIGFMNPEEKQLSNQEIIDRLKQFLV